MNIFFLDRDPITCAQYHCDKHVVKMILETAQLLSTAHYVRGSWEPPMYKPTHVNHPCAVWVRSSERHYSWASRLLSALLAEYSIRYRRVHATAKVSYHLHQPPPNLPKTWADPPLAMPDEFKRGDGEPVESYRRYYAIAKRSLLKYSWRDPPPWLSDLAVGS